MDMDMNEDLFELILQVGTYNGAVCYESFDDMEKDAGAKMRFTRLAGI